MRIWPALREAPELAPYAERVGRHGYDPAYAPIEEKTAATVGYGPAGERDHGPPGGTRKTPGARRGLPAERTQVVLLGSDERRVIHRRTHRGRSLLLLRAALAPGLDVQRVLTREPKAIEPLLDELRAAASVEPRLTPAIAGIEKMISAPDRTGRRLACDVALAHAGGLLVEHAPPAVADAFCASRLDHDWAPTFGTLPASADVAAIIEYARLRAS